MTLQLALLLGYSALLVGLGLLIGRRVSGTKDFFVAGRRLGPGLIFSTMLAANVGGTSTVGATGLGYRDGLSAWWWVGSAAMGSIVLALWIGPRIRRIAERHELKTVGDFLELRYGRNVRAITSLLLWMGSLAVPAAQLIAISTILNVVTGLPKYAGEVVRQRGSSPKLQVLNTALMTAQLGATLKDARSDREFWGRLTESAVGGHLANAAATGECSLFYWRDRNREVDFVVQAGRALTHRLPRS